MKTFIFLLSFLLPAYSSYCQSDSLIQGTWRAIGGFTQDVYINQKTDSTYLSPTIKSTIPDSATQANLVMKCKELFSSVRFYFGKNYEYINSSDSLHTEKGHYRIIPSQHVIELTHSNEAGEEKKDVLIYKLKEALLHITYIAPNGLSLNFILEKQL